MEFFSHPDKKLIVHLKEVKNLSYDKIPEDLKTSYEIIALCHDFGKYTTYFQKHLRGQKANELSNHGFISAIFAAFSTFNQLGEDTILPLIIYSVVIHHHGNLENIERDLPISFKEIGIKDSCNLLDKIEIAKKQIEDIKINRKAIEEEFEYKWLRESFNDFLDSNKIEEVLKRLKRLDAVLKRSSKTEKHYFYHQILYAALISSDKISASNTELPEEAFCDFKELNKSRIEKFKNFKGSISDIRNEIFQNVQDTLEKSYKENRIFSITSPTGTGKTYTGFFAALKLRDLLGENRKIVYSLPFTSIIEQNYDAIYELLNNVDNFEKESSRYIIKHHNLANVEYKGKENKYTVAQSEILIENWSSGIVVTTFVQLLETLIGSRNRMLKKFNSLKGAIILLDEVQAIDIKYFNLVDFILRKACEYLDCRIIMMTATRPFILNDGIELLYDNQKYFSIFNRTKIMPLLENITIEEFVENFCEKIENKSYLIICNTINQSLKIYDMLKALDREVYYLSTNLLPVHRRERIEAVRQKLKNGEKVILISTQVVEAGVDFDFDVVIRDIAPLDSIIQCAGRCNRNSKSESGDVFVYSMIDDKGENFGKYVYGTTLISISKEILKDKSSIEEKDYYSLINKYFTSIKECKSQQESTVFINSIYNLNFSEKDYPLYEFSLIKNNPGYMDVLFIINEEARSVFNDYCRMIDERNFDKKREIYLKIKSKIRDYTISLPEKYHTKFVEEKGLFILPYEGYEQFYDFNTGFKRQDEENFIFF